MIEVIDQETNQKMMAMIFGGIQYQNDRYVVYCIRRDKMDANVFVSKLVQNSQGDVMDTNFDNGEIKVLEGIIQKILSKRSKKEIEKDGFSFFTDFSWDGVNYFDINKCYITTVPRNLIKECMIYYGLVREEIFDQPVIEVVSPKKFNKGFISNVILILFGIAVLIFSMVIVIGFLFDK